jgi:hypothetical protein
MRIRVQPARADLRVHDPDTGRPLSPEGASVIDQPYWRRRLADGDVMRVPKRKRRTPKTADTESPAEG